MLFAVTGLPWSVVAPLAGASAARVAWVQESDEGRESHRASMGRPSLRRRPLARECRPRRRWELVEVKQLLGRVSRNLGWNYSVEPFLLGMR